MIVGQENLADGMGLPPIVKETLEYLKTLQENEFPTQRREPNEKGIYVNFADTVTKLQHERVFEAHQTYVDLHYIVMGKERIDLGQTDDMKQTKAYDEKEDYALYDGEWHSSVHMRKGSFLLCFPGEAHRVLVAQDSPSFVKKAIAKIPVALFR